MLFTKIASVCSENHKKHVNTIRVQKENPCKFYSK